MDQSTPPQVPFRYRHDGWTPARQRAFLIALGTGGCVRDACKAVGLASTSAYRAKRRMSEFGAAWDKALERMTPVLEHVAYTRAVDGWEEPVFQGGKLIGHKWRWPSDAAKPRRRSSRGDAGRSLPRDADLHC